MFSCFVLVSLFFRLLKACALWRHRLNGLSSWIIQSLFGDEYTLQMSLIRHNLLMLLIHLKVQEC